jgi:hypothetical protein
MGRGFTFSREVGDDLLNFHAAQAAGACRQRL